jgi:hypothetical protein
MAPFGSKNGFQNFNANFLGVDTTSYFLTDHQSQWAAAV